MYKRREVTLEDGRVVSKQRAHQLKHKEVYDKRKADYQKTKRGILLHRIRMANFYYRAKGLEGRELEVAMKKYEIKHGYRSELDGQ